jgi:hypothetical protein
VSDGLCILGAFALAALLVWVIICVMEWMERF